MRIVLVDRDGDVVAGLGCRQRVEVVTDPDHARRVRKRLELGRDEKRLRLRVPDDRGDLARGEARAHRHDDRAELQHGEVDDRILDPVRRHDGDAIAAADAEPRERPRELVRARVERPVRHAIVADDVRRLAAADPRVAAEDVAEDEHYLSSIRISR